MGYSHTQKAPLHYIFYPLVLILTVLAWLAREETAAVLVFGGMALIFMLVAFMFQHLMVRDEEEWLAIRYGPLPLFRFRIPYADMTSVERSRSSVIDGWGIHWIPGRGQTYNLWGFDCAQLTVRGRVVRIGSDDADGLVDFLHSKIRS